MSLFEKKSEARLHVPALRSLTVAARCAFALATGAACAQQPQNPSPMVEHTRAHLRLAEQPPPQGRREKLDVGTLFLPAGLKNGAPILFFFHGDTWIPEVAAARNPKAPPGARGGPGPA